MRVYRFAGLAATILLTACLAVTAQPPEKKGPPDEKGGQGKGGFGKGGQGKGGFGGGMGMGGGQPGQILPAFLQEVLKLSDDQKKQVADIQKDVDAKLDKILTDDQKKQLKDMRSRGPGGFGGGPGGPGGPPKDGPPKKGN